MATLTLTVTNDSPNGAGTVQTPADGTWGSKTISIRVVAWYSALETDVDNAGIRRTTVAAWDNITVAANDSLLFAFAHSDPPPDHYSFYYQVATSWDSANSAAKCTAVIETASLTQSTCAVADDDDTATITFGATANSVTINPVYDLPPAVRENTLRAYNGALVKADYADTRLLDSLDIIFNVTASAVAQAGLMRLMRWIKNSVRLTAAWSQTGGDTFLESAVGKFSNTSYLQAAGMTAAYDASLTFLIESEVEEN